MEVLQEAIRKQPDLPATYLYLGMLHEEQKQYEEALKAFDRGLEKNSKDVDLLFRKGVVLDKLERKKEAVEVMRKVLAIEPRNSNALNFVGYSYAEMGVNLVEAKHMIRTALEIEPEDGYIMDSMAWVHYKMGQYKKALEYILEALKRVPQDPVILEHLGDIYLSLGKKNKAAEAYQKSLESQHSEPEKIRQKLEKLQ